MPSVTPTLLATPTTTNNSQSRVSQLECGGAVGQEQDEHQYSEGGLKANLTVIGAFIGLFCTFGQMNAFGAFQAWYAGHELSHMPASTISWIGSLQLWIFFFSGAPIGRLFDVYGPTGLMLAGTLCYLTSMMTMSISTQYYQYILCQGILLGLGVGLIFYPTMSSISTHFSKYRATALGIAAAGSGLGGVVFPITFRALFDRLGFGWGVRISGLAGGVGCIAATMMVSSLSSHKKPQRYFDLKTIVDARFVLLIIGSCFVALGLFIPFFYIVEYARHLGIPDHTSFYVLAVMNAGGVLGRIALAYVSDTIGRFNLLTPAAFLSGLSCVTLWLFLAASTGSQGAVLAGVMVFAVAFGFFSGAYISLVNPCVAQISDIGIIGTRIGLLYSVISFPSLLGGPTAGALLMHEHGSYTAMIIFSGTTLMIGSVSLFGANFVQIEESSQEYNRQPLNLMLCSRCIALLPQCPRHSFGPQSSLHIRLHSCC
ncbi:major facilitator superfamily domain-containing protein [Gymnopilus junonius]|uniref:Major facilitator superfamily domain-containing protein n=1 Tax=Gymnopilus junonius TaxID=109634 RepID=A0A9P5TKX1_GYMJU|nr:major facilitator superfamily domain-containing protein [Gymnopilus junonius]